MVLGAVAGLALLLGVLNFYARGAAVLPDDGVRWADSAAGVIAVDVDVRGAAAAAGVRVGDRLLELDGEAPASALAAEEAPWHRPPGTDLALRLERGAQMIEVSLPLEARTPEGQLYPYLVTVGLFFLASGLLVLYRLGAGGVSLLYFALSLAAFALFCFSHTGAGGWLDWLFYGLDTGGRLLFPALMLHFVLTVPGTGRVHWLLRVLVYTPVVACAALTLWLVALGGVLLTRRPVLTLEQLDAWELLATAAYLTACMAVATVRSARTTTLSVRRQSRWMAWGLGLGIMPFVVFYLIPSGLQVDTPPAASLSVLPLIVLPMAFSTAILKYRLADLGLLVRGGVRALTLIFFSLALFALLHLALRQTFTLPGVNRRFLTVVAAVLVFLLYPVLRQGVGALVDRVFYLGRYDYRRTLQEFGRELNSERELVPLVDKFHDRIRRTLPVRSSLILLPDDDPGGLALMEEPGDGRPRGPRQRLAADHPLAGRLDTEECVTLGRDDRRSLPGRLRRAGLHALFPMRVKGKVVAVLGVALKDSEGEMNSEDRQLLVTLAGHAASAIEGARLYEENLERIREVEILKDYNENIVESSQVGILVLDSSQEIQGWNRTMERMFGHPRQQVLGRPLGEIFGRHLEPLLAQVPPQGNRMDRVALPALGQAGRTFNLSAAELRLRSGARRGLVVTFDEITEQMRMEQQLLQNERLAAVGLLASGVAHEINTPLTGIASYAEMLLEELGQEHSAREIVDRIHKQSWRASHIANSLLNFSRGGGSDFGQVDLLAVVEETLSLFGPQIRGRNVEIEFRPELEINAEVRGHRGRLQQVLLNLLLNARDAMPTGGVIRISTFSAGGSAGLEVQDCGEGIAPEHLDRIYDPFFTTKSQGRGTGLGLSVSYGIVRDHGGTIEVKSRPGEGCRFRLSFPAWSEERVSA